jgi:hypothetical protein
MTHEQNPHTPGTPEHADWRMLREEDEHETRVRRAEEIHAERTVETKHLYTVREEFEILAKDKIEAARLVAGMSAELRDALVSRSTRHTGPTYHIS